jgi:hypothetical protein
VRAESDIASSRCSPGCEPEASADGLTATSTTIRSAPSAEPSSAAVGRRETTVSARREKICSGRYSTPSAPYQYSSSRWNESRPRRQLPTIAGRRMAHSTVPPLRSSR